MNSEEFEARQTPEAKYAAALDRVQPMLHNYRTQGKAWQEEEVGTATDRGGHTKMRATDGITNRNHLSAPSLGYTAAP